VLRESRKSFPLSIAPDEGWNPPVPRSSTDRNFGSRDTSKAQLQKPPGVARYPNYQANERQ
jgi:hypothetical protein